MMEGIKPTELLRAIQRMVMSAWHASPLLALKVGALSVVRSALPISVAFVFKLAVSGVINRSFAEAFTALALLGGYAVVATTVGWLATTNEVTLEERTDHWLEARLVTLTSAVPVISHLEDKEFLDSVHVLTNQRRSMNGSISTLAAGAGLLGRLIVAEVILAQVSPILLAFPLLAFPIMAAGSRVERMVSDGLTAAAEQTRLAGKLFQLGADPSAGRELRIYQLGEELVARETTLLSETDAAQWRIRIRAMTLQLAAWVIFAAGLAAALFEALRAERSATAGGNVLLVVILVVQIASQTDMASIIVSNIARQAMVFRRYDSAFSRARELLQAGSPAEPMKEPPTTIRHGIDVDNVSYSYPGGSEPALRDVSMHIPAGSTVALVGANGAGKSTLVKLLLKLYDPDSGQISIDDVSIAKIAPDLWRARCSAGFQDFCKFELVAAESVGVGHLPHLDDRTAINDALRRAGSEQVFSQAGLTLDANLGKTFADGVDLSAGQWQQVALARAMMPPIPLLLVMDEPTANLDPERERELFRAYANAARAYAAASGAILVLVSHRLASVRDADLIVVLDRGRVVEQGTHQELRSGGGVFAEMFDSQAQGYR